MGGGILGNFAVEPIHLEVESRAPFSSATIADDTIAEIEQVLGIVFSHDLRDQPPPSLRETHIRIETRSTYQTQERKAKAAAKRRLAKEESPP